MFPSQCKDGALCKVSPGEGMMTRPPSLLLGIVRPGLWIQTDGGQRVAYRWWKPWPVLTSKHCCPGLMWAVSPLPSSGPMNARALPLK